MNERGERHGDVNRPERTEPDGPTSVEFLVKAVRHPSALELNLVPCRPVVSGRALKRCVEAVAAVVKRPDRETVGNGPGTRWQTLRRHEIDIVSEPSMLNPAFDQARTPANFRDPPPPPGGELRKIAGGVVRWTNVRFGRPD